MNKEEKLISLGYSNYYDNYIFAKENDNYLYSITIYYNEPDLQNEFSIYMKKDSLPTYDRCITSQSDIDNLKNSNLLSQEEIEDLQKEFNNLKREFEEVNKLQDL